MVPSIAFQAFVDPVGDPQQGQFPQCDQIALAEIVAQRSIDDRFGIDVPVRHPAAQGLRTHVDEFDLVGAPDDFVGHRLRLGDAGDVRDDIVE